MKYFIVFVILFAAFMLWRASRASRHGTQTRKPPTAQPPRLEDMVSCALCELHVPQADAMPGRKGLYCCADHRQRAEG